MAADSQRGLKPRLLWQHTDGFAGLDVEAAVGPIKGHPHLLRAGLHPLEGVLKRLHGIGVTPFVVRVAGALASTSVTQSPVEPDSPLTQTAIGSPDLTSSGALMETWGWQQNWLVWRSW